MQMFFTCSISWLLISIVTGSIDGNFISVFEKIAKLQAKTPFSFTLVVGDLFADPASETDDAAVTSLLNGEVNVALPTYFTIGHYALPPQIIKRLESNEGEICSNLYFLGKRATTKTSEGIRIVSLGGVIDADTTGLSKDKYHPFYTEADARSLHGVKSADILLTSSWPADIRAGSQVVWPENNLEPSSERCIAELCGALKPKYHFSTSRDIFFEREPFFHAPKGDSSELCLTRFLSLASTTSSSKAKWLYAFSLNPSAASLTELPAGTTASPLLSTKKRTRTDDYSYSRFSTDSGHRPSKRKQKGPVGPSECFFCLANPNLGTHLITSIAEDSYLTTAKGPLTLSSTYPALKTPGHILLIPLSHSPTLATIPEADSRESTYKELQRYRSALQSMLASEASHGLGAVTWEISRPRGVHFHWQFLPVPRELVTRGLVEAAFRIEAENEKYPAFSNHNIGDGTGEGEYFRVWIWQPGKLSSDDSENVDATNEIAKETEIELVLPLSPDVRFEVQFGRRVMAKLLGLEKRIDWKDCVQSEAEEIKDVNAFKAIFKPWDFSLEG